MNVQLYPLTRNTTLSFAASIILLFSGCATMPATERIAEPLTVKAFYTSKPVRVDGFLNDEIWNTAPAYQLVLSQDRAIEGEEPAEPGEVRFGWDDTYFYLAAKFHDLDIVAHGDENQSLHWIMGDLVELFLKPEGYTWYWELYATPRSKKTSLWYPGRGYYRMSAEFCRPCGLQVAAQNNGTVNNWEDEDDYWTAEMAMPIQDLTSQGETFAPGSNWWIFVGRYNYSRYLPWPELSMYPQLSRENYHLNEEYAILQLIK